MAKEDLITELRRLDRTRLERYRDLLQFYEGHQWRKAARSPERQLTFNYARVVVEKVTSYLMSGMSFALEAATDAPGARSSARRAEDVVYRIYEENNLEALDFETELDAAVLGDGCYKLTWDNERGRVVVTAPDIQGIYAWWYPDDISRVYRVASRYQMSAEEIALTYGVRARGDNTWVSEVWTDEEFMLYVGGELIRAEANPYGFIPFIIFPNLREPKKFWGVSDLPPIMESQVELNRAMSQLSHILELSGNPIAVLENVEEGRDIAIRPGAVWTIPEDARVYLLDLLKGGGVRLHIDYIDLLYRTLHDLGESPRAAFGGTERDLSGVALELEMHPLLQKVRRKRAIRGAVYRRRNLMALELWRRFTGEDLGGVSCRILWGPVLPQDSMRKTQEEQILVQSGIHSRRRAMDELGIRNPERELGRWLEEREAILRMNQELNARSTRPLKREGEEGEKNGL